MKYIKLIIPYLDDIFLAFGLISFVVASYLVNAVLGTYVLGIAFFVAAFFAGTALRSPVVQHMLLIQKNVSLISISIKLKRTPRVKPWKCRIF